MLKIDRLQRAFLVIALLGAHGLAHGVSLVFEAEDAQIDGPFLKRSNPGHIYADEWDSDPNAICFVGCARISLDIPNSGYYSIEALYRTDYSGGAGIDLTIGDVSGFRWRWPASSQWQWARYHELVFLPTGEHVLVLDMYKKQTEIDKVRLNLVREDSNGGLLFGLDDAQQLKAPLVVGNDGGSPSQQALFASTNAGNSTGPEVGGSARFRALVQRPGEYRIKVLARAAVPEQSHDSIYLTAGHLSDFPWHMDLATDRYQWCQDDKTVVRLAPGYHDILVTGRESHTYIKQLLLEWVETSEDIFVFEAEHTDYLEGFDKVADSAASASGYIQPGAGTGAAYYKVFIEEEDTYEVSVLAKSTGGTGEIRATFGAVDAEDEENLGSVNLPQSATYSWYTFAVPKHLEPTTSDLVLATDSAGVQIDQVAVAAIAAKPLSFGAAATQADQAVSTVGFSPTGDGGLVTDNSHDNGVPSGHASYQFTVAESGIYRLKAYVSSPNVSSDSFFVSVGDITNAIWNLDEISDYHWEAYPDTFKLNAGPNIVTLGGREIGTAIAKLALELVRYDSPARPASQGTPGTYTANSPADLNALLLAAVAGDTFVLADGSYPDAIIEVPSTVVGTQANPVTIKAATPGGVTLQGAASLRVYGQHVTVEGMTFSGVGDHGIVLAGSDNRFSSNTIVGSGTYATGEIILVPNGSMRNEISNNDISASQAKSLRVATPAFGRGQSLALDTLIANNYFHDIATTGGPGGEAIQVGYNSAPFEELGTIIRDNTFERADGDGEIISIKSNGNHILDNLFLDSQGELVLRHSNRSVVSGNRMINTQNGIRVSGSGLKVTNNFVYITGGGNGLRLSHGCTNYLPVQGALIAHNTFVVNNNPLRIFNYCGGEIKHDVKGNAIINNVFKVYSASSRQLFVEDTRPVQDNFLLQNWFITNIGDVAGSGPASPLIPAGVELDDVSITLDNEQFPQLQAGSPAIDAGIEGFADQDIRGNARDALPDIGATEYQ